MSIDETVKTLLAAVIITFSWSLAATAMAGESHGDTQWMWSETVPMSSAAATALSEGDFVRGLRLSENVLQQSTDKRDRLIAHHNLCVAHAVRARTQIAERHCQATRRLADPAFVIAAGDTSLTAAELLEANLVRVGHPGLGQFSD